MSKRVYISGPMTGLSREEYLARFAKAENLLRQEGFTVVNPARLLPSRWPWLYRLMGYRLTLLYDLWRLSRCDLIYKIPGWKESHGANIESCWAYHQNICLLYTKTREKIDKKMAKFIDRKWERDDIVQVDLAELQQRAQEHKNLVIVKPDRPAPPPPKKPKTPQP
jgi:hypothetical protein